jgi:hypothetical protein
MSGKGLQDLGLKDEKLPEQTYDDLPEYGSYTPPPQPGKYRFRTAADLSKTFETFDVDNNGTPRQELRVIFDKDAPLTIIAAVGALLQQYVGAEFQTRLSTVRRKRGEVEASDLDFYFKAMGYKSRPAGLKETAQRVMETRNKEFTSEITYNWSCDNKKNIWVANAEGKRVEVENQKGCGKRYYQDDKTKKDEQKIHRQEDGTYPLEISCTCGAVVRAFANLDNMTA